MIEGLSVRIDGRSGDGGSSKYVLFNLPLVPPRFIVQRKSSPVLARKVGNQPELTDNSLEMRPRPL